MFYLSFPTSVRLKNKNINNKKTLPLVNFLLQVFSTKPLDLEVHTARLKETHKKKKRSQRDKLCNHCKDGLDELSEV